MKILAEYGGTRVIEDEPHLILQFFNDDREWVNIQPNEGGQNELMVMIQDLSDERQQLKKERDYLVREVNMWRDVNNTPPYPDKGPIV